MTLTVKLGSMYFPRIVELQWVGLFKYSKVHGDLIDVVDTCNLLRKKVLNGGLGGRYKTVTLALQSFP